MSEDKIFLIVIGTITLLVVVILSLNTYAYSKFIDNPAKGMSTEFATALMWINLIFTILAFGVFCWIIYEIFKPLKHGISTPLESTTVLKSTTPPESTPSTSSRSTPVVTRYKL